jgi:RNA polymerase sigma-B factor
MTTIASLRQDLPRDVRREVTTDLLERVPRARGAERARLVEEVILANTGVARSMAQRYARRGVPVQDLEQVAYLALVRAAQKYDGDRADDFLTYAVPTIRGELKRWFRDHGWAVRPPRAVQELQGAVLRARAEADHELTIDELADRLDVSARSVREALTARGCFAPDSLDAPVRSGDDASAPLGEMLPGVDGGLEECETRLVLEQALDTLEDRDKLVVRLRYSEELSQAEIGRIIGVTQAQVSRILTSITQTLRVQLQDTPLAA